MFVSGLSSQYDSTYPKALRPYLEQRLFSEAMSHVNEKLATYWPCLPALTIGYGCCLCTLGLSLLVPWICIGDAEEALQRAISGVNEQFLNDRGLKMELVKKCCVSWVKTSQNQKKTNNSNQEALERSRLK